jgi:hypothetical protein
MPQCNPRFDLLRQEHQRLLFQLHGRRLLRHNSDLPQRRVRAVFSSNEQLQHEH